MDFRDSAEEAEFPYPLAGLAPGQQPAPAAVVDVGRILGEAARLAPIALPGRIFRSLMAEGVRRPRHAQRLRRHRG